MFIDQQSDGEKAAVIGGTVLMPSRVIALATLACVVGSLPLVYVAVMAAMRIKKFENQLPDLLITIAASLKAPTNLNLILREREALGSSSFEVQ